MNTQWTAWLWSTLAGHCKWQSCFVQCAGVACGATVVFDGPYICRKEGRHRYTNRWIACQVKVVAIAIDSLVGKAKVRKLSADHAVDGAEPLCPWRRQSDGPLEGCQGVSTATTNCIHCTVLRSLVCSIRSLEDHPICLVLILISH